jgi:DNA-binding MarR family transcriptional regulator
MAVSSEECAREIIDVVPLVMRVIRSEMRAQRGPDITVPQFRSLRFISRCPDVTLSDVAIYIGLTLPSMSKMIDGLVNRGLITRNPSSIDRRCIVLTVTKRGNEILKTAQDNTQAVITKTLSTLSNDEREVVVRSMLILQRSFGG